MEIQYLGHSCFRLKGKKTTIVCDPFQSEAVGYKLPKVSAEVVTISHSHPDHNNSASVGGTDLRPQPFVINEPGEYEIGGASFFGLPAFHDGSQGSKRGSNIVFVYIIDGLRLVHLGDLGHPLSEAQLEEINGTDILFVPVGGNYTLDSQQVVEVINQIEPRIVIPMHYQLPHSSTTLAPVTDFLKAIGAETVKPVEKLVITSEKLPEEREVVVLNARS